PHLHHARRRSQENSAPSINLADVKNAVMSAGPSRTRTSPWDELAAALRGALLLPGDTDYETRRHVWNGAIDRHPLAIARCLDAEDVAATAKFAARERVPMT